MSNSTDPSQSHEFHAFAQFEPSEAAAIIFIVVFALLLVGHIGQSIRYKVCPPLFLLHQPIHLCRSGICGR
jgi:hypothetical protein